MRTNTDIQCVWKLQKLTARELTSVIAAHRTWLEAGAPGEPPHNLNQAKLHAADFHGADLSEISLTGAVLSDANFQGAKLFKANLNGADLLRADLSEAFLWEANLGGCILNSANLGRADLRWADLRGSSLHLANLTGADLRGANLSESNLSEAWLSGSVLSKANLAGAEVTGVKYELLRSCRGIRADSCFGSPRFRRDVMDQDFLEEMQETKGGKILYNLWYWSCDCGRSITRWALFSVALALFFALVFWALGPQAFHYPQQLGFGFKTALYGSVVTFTTLGFGDVTPITRLASYMIMAEVVVGYIMLGGLISIFASLVARRAG